MRPSLTASTPDGPPKALPKSFRALCAAQAASSVPHYALNLTLVLLIARATGSSFWSGLLVVALLAPATVGGLVAGNIADRFPPGPLMAASHVARAAICVLLLMHPHAAPAAFVAALAISTAAQFASNAQAVAIPAIVPSDQLARANAIRYAISTACQVVGFGILPAVSFRLLGGPVPVLSACVALFVVAAAFALGVTVPRRRSRREPREPESWWRAGWVELRSRPVAFRAAANLTVVAIAGTILASLAPAFVHRVLDLPPDVGLSALFPAAGGGAAALALAPRLAKSRGSGVLAFAMLTLFGALVVALSAVRVEAATLTRLTDWASLQQAPSSEQAMAVLATAVISAPMGFAFVASNVFAQTAMNQALPLHCQGKAAATQGAVAALASVVPVLAVGAFADVAGVPTAMVAVAAMLALALFYSASQRLILRRLFTEVAHRVSPRDSFEPEAGKSVISHRNP